MVVKPLEANSPCKTRTGFADPRGLRDMKNITDLIALAFWLKRPKNSVMEISGHQNYPVCGWTTHLKNLI